jgi:NDP-sugar pyrophosphorylase family protein
VNKKFQIVIPMSGFGERFRRAGYAIPKPLIEVDGRAIIGHVVDLFPGETDFTFICNEDHLANQQYRMVQTLRELCPTGRVVGIPSHKLGPVHAVRQVEHLLDPNRPVVVNYCDFACYWDWDHFKSFVILTACAGAIPAYKGFHPHTLGTTNYAYMKEVHGSQSGNECSWLLDIQEKQPYTDNRMDEYASSGTYYFASAKIMGEAFAQTMDQNINVGGEFYVSLAYKSMLAQGEKIAIYPLQHFMQWGTPDDLAEYKSWSQTFKSLISGASADLGELNTASGSLVIPMAGLGKRFADEGYALTKPLIPVFGRAMANQAIHDLPKSKYQSLVLRSDMPGLADIKASIKEQFPNAILTCVPGVTEGQACTALIGLDVLESFASSEGAKLDSTTDAPIDPVTFGACDNGVLFNQKTYQALLDNPEVDVIVWGARGHANAVRKPQMFGWIDADSKGAIHKISVKTPLASPTTDPIVIGTFTFKKSSNARRAINMLIARNGRINGEFYLDSCINDALALGLRCYLFEVDNFISWGTPNDLKTFEYWQSCFHKWAHHPYRLELDSRLNSSALAELNARYATLALNPLNEYAKA